VPAEYHTEESCGKVYKLAVCPTFLSLELLELRAVDMYDASIGLQDNGDSLAFEAASTPSSSQHSLADAGLPKKYPCPRSKPS
jgi:hypothetical protein